MSRNEDVIELGSSDEELQPASKKQKPPPGAMVYIPHKLPGITIRPAKSSSSSKIEIPSKKITVKKSDKRPNPLAMKVKVNDIRPKKKTSSTVGDMPISTKTPIVTNKNSITSVHGTQAVKSFLPIKISNPNVNRQVIYPTGKQIIYPALNPNSYFSQPLHVKQKLPPSVTIKRFKLHQNNLPPAKRKKVQPPKSGEVPTVELDDDEANTSEKDSTSTGPQWYMRPEEEMESNDQKLQNNTEPEPSKMIEITIEDSPVKPINKKTCEIGTEYAVTIEDSPVRPKNRKQTSESEGENDDNENKKEYHSKKKLNYPNDSSSKKIVEVEIEPLNSQPLDYNEKNSSETNTVKKTIAVETIEIEESPLKTVEGLEDKTPKKIDAQIDVLPSVQPVTMKKFTEDENDTVKTVPIEIDNTATSEFHLTYQSFIDLCFKLENSDDMKKIVEKKIKAYYLQVPKAYTESEEFLDMVSGKIISMKASPEKMYLYIKDVVDELNLQRKLAKTKVEAKDEKSIEVENFLYGEESQFDSKRKRQIRKLEKTLKKLHRAIQKLEEQEVDFDDDEDSVYLLTERYKERMVKVHAKFCQLTNTKLPSEPRVHIDARPGQPQGPAKRLEKWINRKVPIGTPLPFPDFHDVLRCVKEANEQDNLGWNDVDIMEEARDLFTRCGKKLQRRRQENEWRLAVSRIPADVDPAEDSEDLRRKLNENRQTATKKETEVFNKFADKQKQLKLEAVEIGDKEAEESPADSEDDEANDDECEALEDKEKRKDRIKRLLHEKNKKIAIEKEENKSEKMETDATVKENDASEKANTDDIPKTNTESILTNKSEESKKNKADTDDIVNSLSDSSKIDSDIDELHLLQKLHSGNEVNYSSEESSNSESPIDISDTLESSSDNENKLKSDEIISIENSSYSESETAKEIEMDNIEKEYIKESDPLVHERNDVQDNQKDAEVKESNDAEVESEEVVSKEVPLQTMEIEYTALGNARKIITNDEADSLTAEEILLASSEEDSSKSNSPNNVCMIVNDDAMSIGETCIEFQDDEESGKPENVNKSNVIDDNSVDVSIVSDSGNKNNDKISEDSTKQVKATKVIDSEGKSDKSETLKVNSEDQGVPKEKNGEKCVVTKDQTLNDGETMSNVESEEPLHKNNITNVDKLDSNINTNDIESNDVLSIHEPVKCSKNSEAVDNTNSDMSQHKSIVEIVSI